LRALALGAVLLAFPATADAYRHRMPQPPHVWAHHEPCPVPGIETCADPDTDEVWLPPGSSAFAWSHELAHIFDARVLAPIDREWLTVKLGFPAGTPWFAGLAESAPGEFFADAYAACDLGLVPTRGQWFDTYGYRPSARRHLRICNAIVFIGWWRAGLRSGSGA
jgi:hypothetical protein